jgi:SPP1 family predicted phage head-tail adaptor
VPVIRRSGDRRHSVALQESTRTASGEGYADTWATYATVWASVRPSAPSTADRQVGQTQQTPITHIVELDYRSDISAAHRVLFGTRPLYIRGLQNVEERNKTTVLACEERAV